MSIRLITGVPGAGKTLYAVSQIVAPLVGTTVQREGGEPTKRRIMVGGVRDLLIEHEVIAVPSFDPAAWAAGEGDRAAQRSDTPRNPGEPPRDVEERADNWYDWCRPGDVIVIDECQTLFRPMAAGRKPPPFITELERHRHYGVDFVLITQHPQLLHASVRNLVGQYQHVRRILGSHSCMVYEWDHCTSPDRTKGATSRMWRHDKRAYALYKSAELHTKSKHTLPFAAFGLVAAIVLIPALGWWIKGRMEARYATPTPAAQALAFAASAPAPGPSPAASAPQQPTLASGTAAMPPKAALAVGPDIVYAGCIATASRCVCIVADGRPRVVDEPWCRRASREFGLAVPYPVSPVASAVAPVQPAPAVAAAPRTALDAADAPSFAPRGDAVDLVARLR